MKRIIIIFTALILFGATGAAAQRVDLEIVTDEADAVLRILEKKENAQEITPADWEKIFSSEGYTRLKKRETAFKRPFEETAFQKFVLSNELGARRKILAETLAAWKKTDVERPAAMALAYLPAAARIRARVYPVIKPADNSFVFDLKENPAIFLYLDPAVTREQFENTLAHELHHIGFGTACPTAEVTDALKKYSPGMQKVLDWTGAFGEGFAMLAAAGGPDVHPHAVSAPEDKARWDKDLANFNNDLKAVEKFFLDLDAGKLSAEKERETAFSFFGVQGPWYTVGWQMAVVIEKTDGRARLIEDFCDPRRLLPAYNKAVVKYNRRHKTQLASWSKELIDKIGL
ncbi:MAG: hypothetical protein JSS81_19550 [Acidobacteria bacterium]|nr:hypothetical protein [Acidobacteriota bacterium]